MKNTTETGKKKMVKGIVQLIWEEMKTLNKAKFQGLYQVLTGYLRMKYFKPKNQQKVIPNTTGKGYNKDTGTPPLTY